MHEIVQNLQAIPFNRLSVEDDEDRIPEELFIKYTQDSRNTIFSPMGATGGGGAGVVRPSCISHFGKLKPLLKGQTDERLN